MEFKSFFNRIFFHFKKVMVMILIFHLSFVSSFGQYLGGIDDGFASISTTPVFMGVTMMFQGGSDDGFVKISVNGLSLGSAALARLSNVSPLEEELIESSNSENWSIYTYPNPVSSSFKLVTDDESLTSVQVSIIDSNGKVLTKIFLEQQVDFDVHSLPSGPYLVQVKTEKTFKILRIIVTH
jgi:hypothetical protein